MGTGYALAYRLGITPWERAGEAADESFKALLDREESERSRPWGRALDLGCGTGTHTRQLAERGWQATGVDNVPRAIEAATGKAGSRADFVVGDVTRLADAGLAGDVSFFLDVGCFHGLSDDQRLAVGRGVTALARPDATLLMLCFTPHHHLPLIPHGASQADVERAFTGWAVVSVDAADTSGMPAPLRKTAPQWFRLRRG